ncbi:MAG: hypothetical protein M1840_006173 [Geoglossum simile]|nr:MAG: hypothetical protein M1840_006173 [Geoglossum simile]
MTSLFTSFIIEPVVRQARGFSRSSTAGDSPRPSIAQYQLSVDRVATVGVGAAVEDEVDDGRPRQTASGEGPGSRAVTALGAIWARSFVSSPLVVDEGPEIVLEVPRQSHSTHSGPPLGYPSTATGSVEGFHLELGEESQNPAYQTPILANLTNSPTTPSSGASQAVANVLSPAEGPSSRCARQSPQSSTSGSNSRPRSNTLPEDDGMRELRDRIKAIQEMDIPSALKAKMMHGLMVERYNQYHSALQNPQQPTPDSPGSTQSQDGLYTPPSLTSVDGSPKNPLVSISPTFGGKNPHNLTATDLIPTYAPAPAHSEPDGLPSVTGAEPRDLGCHHYKRNVKLQCSICSRWYTCRFCHDDTEDHSLVRKDTKNMLCMLCGCAQPASERCLGCGERAAWYYCDKCKLWDNDSDKAIYHCNDCGLCRIGRGLGKDYYHCKTCSVCVSMSMKDHRCIERSTDCDCPICGEYMFTSTLTVVFMSCGHSIHHKCYYDHMKTSYKCPICNRSIVNMETQFRNLDRTIESQPMPPQFQDTKALVSCNDCSAKSSTKYHWLGLKCAVCHSYNTVQLQILSGPDADRDNLQAANASGHSDYGITHTRSPARHVQPTALGHPVPQPPSQHIYTRPSPPSTDTDNEVRSPPYPLPRRASRSVSPPCIHPPYLVEMEVDNEDEEEVDFWGGSSPRDQTIERGRGGGDDEEEDTGEDMEDDTDDAEDIDIFGHR